MTPEKGPHRAIAAARAVDVPLVLAGVIQPGQQAFFDREIAPHIDGDRVRFVGEVTARPSARCSRARAGC
jgi:glycosyltransferase involved in cell wall biosynthesis